MVESTRLWHYTTDNSIRDILADREIRPTAIGIEQGERPAAWFSTNSVWEPTALKLIQDKITGQLIEPGSMQVLAKYCRLIRIEADPEAVPIDWPTFKAVSGISPKMASALEKVAKKQGAKPSQWYASFEPVGIDDWIDVEVWGGLVWEPLIPA